MLKDLMYQAVYRDEQTTVSIILENPVDHMLGADMLSFSVVIESKLDRDFAFYLMDENAIIYNFKVHKNGIIYTELNPMFLFQDLCIVLHDRFNNQMNLIRLTY